MSLAEDDYGMEASDRVQPRSHVSSWHARARVLVAGGPDGNEQLTTIGGAILIVLLAVIGITIIRIGQLLWLHLFIGLLMLGPVAVKMASTGYRFVRYYTRNPVYRTKGPPDPILRAIAPVVVASTLMVFVTGIVLLITGVGGKDQWLLLHKVAFFVWAAFTGLHVLGHLPAYARYLRPGGARAELLGTRPGAAGRWLLLAGGLAVGVIIAVALIPDFSSWTAHTAAVHGDH